MNLELYRKGLNIPTGQSKERHPTLGISLQLPNLPLLKIEENSGKGDNNIEENQRRQMSLPQLAARTDFSVRSKTKVFPNTS